MDLLKVARRENTTTPRMAHIGIPDGGVTKRCPISRIHLLACSGYLWMSRAIASTTPGRSWGTDPNSWVDLPTSYHCGACGLGFADGHSEIRKWVEKSTQVPVKMGQYNGFPAPNSHGACDPVVPNRSPTPSWDGLPRGILASITRAGGELVRFRRQTHAGAMLIWSIADESSKQSLRIWT